MYEVDLETLESTLLYNLVKELDINGQVHFKDMHSAQGKVVVTNNTYEGSEFLGKRAGGCIPEWDGKECTIIERN